MKSLISALVIGAASLVSPVQAGIHDFSGENARPAAVPNSNCFVTGDKSAVCWQRDGRLYSVAIADVDAPNQVTSVIMDCSTGKWRSYGALAQATVSSYMSEFCNNN
jgi:hypothetical protein